MSNKNQIYLAGLAMYIVAGVAGYAIDAYWIILLLSVLIAGFTYVKLFGANGDEEVRETTKFDWASIFAFCAVELVLTICISLFKADLTGFVGYLNLFAQMAAYVCIGYVVIRYTLANTSFHKMLIKKFKKEAETVEETTTEEVVEEISSAIEETKAEPVVEEYNEVEVVGSIQEPEIKSIELKVEETKEIDTPYMEEEI